MQKTGIISSFKGVLSDQNLLLVIGASFIVLAASITLFSGISFIFGYPIAYISIFAAVYAVFLFKWWAIKDSSPDYNATLGPIVFIFFSTVLVSILISGYFYDLSYDGQAYHQEAVIQLSNGWNPFHDLPLSGMHEIWINHYAKGPWIIATVFYKLIGRIEVGKIFNLLYLCASFWIMLSALLAVDKLKKKNAVLLSLLFALNPIAVNQSLSFYIDGQLASLLTSMVALSYLIIKRADKINLLVYSLVILLALNIRFTAVVYVSVLVFGLVAGLLVYGQRETAVKLIKITVVSYLVGIVIIGYNPYITNTLRQGHPFYPSSGSKAINIVDSNMPADFRGQNELVRLFKSMFSKSSNVFAPGTTRLKIPFTIGKNELNVFSGPDTRVSGFGPLFGGVVILSVLLSLLYFLSNMREKTARKESFIVLLFLFVITVTSLANPEVWWARYTPQIWLLPIILLVVTQRSDQARILRFFSAVVTITIIANIALTSATFIHYQYVTNKTLKKQLVRLRDSSEPTLVKFNNFASNRVRFKEMGINYEEVSDLSIMSHMALVESETHVSTPK